VPRPPRQDVTDTRRSVAKSKTPCTLADAKAQKYEPRGVCNPPK
jgi:hypothetical protein